jgi:hypothetical protein
MGLDFSYLLYFKRQQLWDALQGVVSIAAPQQPPAEIHFPGHVLSLPLDTWGWDGKEPLRWDDPDFRFALVLKFDPDEAILDYLFRRGIGDMDIVRSPPGGENQAEIGFIYLTIHQQIPEQPDPDLVLFDFGTTGTRMSLLFDESVSIRKTFLELIERLQGVCGVFNRESGGEVFWLNGQSLSEVYIEDSYLPPAEIEKMLKDPGG